MNNDLNNTEKKEGKIYGVLETSFDWKECRTEKFIQQKLNYIHWNPCKGNKLVELPEQYVHSSAKFYIEGEQGIYPVTSLMELRDIDLTNSQRETAMSFLPYRGTAKRHCREKNCMKSLNPHLIEECRTSIFIQKKLNYMHWNPCKGQNKIVDLPEEYIHSSAKFYITGGQGIYPVTSHTELEDINLTK